HAIELDGTGLCIQARAFAAWANRVQHIVGLGLGKALLAALVVGVAYRVVKHLALLLAELDARAHAVRAPAVLAVVAEEARVQFGIGRGADRAGALGRKSLQLANRLGAAARHHG